MVRKVSTLIFAWVLGLVASIVMAPFSMFFAGAVVGALVTAVAMGLAVKWSIKNMLDSTMADVERMQEQLEGGMMHNDE